MKKNDLEPASKPARKRTTKSSKTTVPMQEPSFSLPPEAWDNLLKVRAQTLAQELENGAIAEYVEVVVFVLAYETYGINTDYVREVYPLKDLTPLPCTPSFVENTKRLPSAAPPNELLNVVSSRVPASVPSDLQRPSLVN